MLCFLFFRFLLLTAEFILSSLRLIYCLYLNLPDELMLSFANSLKSTEVIVFKSSSLFFPKSRNVYSISLCRSASASSSSFLNSCSFISWWWNCKSISVSSRSCFTFPTSSVYKFISVYSCSSISFPFFIFSLNLFLDYSMINCFNSLSIFVFLSNYWNLWASLIAEFASCSFISYFCINY